MVTGPQTTLSCDPSDVKSVYRKLGVASRDEAVEVGRQLGVI